MKRASSNQFKTRVELFSDMMLMKLKPKNTEGVKQLRQIALSSKAKQEYSSSVVLDPSSVVLDAKITRSLNQIRYLEVASKQAIIIGNYNQVDMINIDGLAYNFIDTFYYWSLNIGRAIMDVKINIKSNYPFIQSNSWSSLPIRLSYSIVIIRPGDRNHNLFS